MESKYLKKIIKEYADTDINCSDDGYEYMSLNEFLKHMECETEEMKLFADYIKKKLGLKKLKKL